MRIDDFLSTVGIIKRRTIAKEMGTNGLVVVNGRPVKPSYEVKAGDIIHIKGSHPCAAEVLDVPTGSVAKAARERYFKPIPIPQRSDRYTS
jgi:ribosomal 50S subunit-recycling heat shock protein